MSCGEKRGSAWKVVPECEWSIGATYFGGVYCRLDTIGDECSVEEVVSNGLLWEQK